MTDTEWHEIRNRWRAKVKDGDLKCDYNMVPFALDNCHVPWQWVSRQYVERLRKITSDPTFKRSVSLGRRALGNI